MCVDAEAPSTVNRHELNSRNTQSSLRKSRRPGRAPLTVWPRALHTLVSLIPQSTVHVPRPPLSIGAAARQVRLRGQPLPCSREAAWSPGERAPRGYKDRQGGREDRRPWGCNAHRSGAAQDPFLADALSSGVTGCPGNPLLRQNSLEAVLDSAVWPALAAVEGKPPGGPGVSGRPFPFLRRAHSLCMELSSQKTCLQAPGEQLSTLIPPPPEVAPATSPREDNVNSQELRGQTHHRPLHPRRRS